MGLKELGEAERLVDELLAPGAKSADIYRYKAELVEDREGNKKALRWFKDAVRAESENHEANCELAFALYRLGKSREALPFALKARETKPTEDNAAATLCAILADLGERDEEIAELHRRSA
jgi:tetratricopeptide (TPR) repeat protein